MAFYQKYRPKKFADLIGEDHIRDTLIEAIKKDRLSHAYLLSGPRGTGKTTTARLLAKALNCQKIAEAKRNNKEMAEPCNQCQSCLDIDTGRAIDLIEIDAASHTKVDEIREVIDKARLAPTVGPKKIYIIDEVHMLSTSSFNALLKTLEEPPKHAVFILATTEVAKLPATIISRTQRFDYQRVATQDLIKNLKKIAEKEKISIDEEALRIIAINAEGGHRDAVGLLEQVTPSSKNINHDDVVRMLGLSDSVIIYKFVDAIFNAKPEEGLKIAHKLYEDGKNMIFVSRQVTEVLRKILLYKASGQSLFDETLENIKIIKKLSTKKNNQGIISLIERFIEAGSEIKIANNSILPIEIAVVEAASASVESNEDATVNRDNENNTENSIDIKPLTKQFSVAEKASQQADKMSSESWKLIVEEVKKQNSTLAALLRDTKPIRTEKNQIVLGVKFPFHKDKISEAKNIKILEGVVEDAFQIRCEVACELLKKQNNNNSSNDDELLETAEALFK